MSTTSSATTTLYVNGRPAQDELARLRADLDKYKKQLLDIASDPSKGLGSKEWDEARKKLKATETELNRVANNVPNVTRALSRLDKATPGELRKYLRQLKQELAGIERGSKAWDEHMKKIRAVQTEINKLNNEMKGHQSLWNRFADKMFAWGVALQTVWSGITGLSASMREAVNAYAEMDQEMANVRKFTGMTTEQVAELNEEFKKMDTRTSREHLNQLAQDAGRLGKSSKEDVMGFVRAADQINVALDDLGEGATLTLSKIAGAFGDEDRYGTEQALLKTGSVINELSQNCRASAPYLAEFAQRLTGAGTTAKMTTAQLMAFGAVLDSNGAQLESSATALGQIIIKLYRDPAKYAEAAGMEVKKFTELLKTDANEAVLMFLQTLHDAGNLDVLAPMLADMGEKGSRSVQTLTMLAGKIDEVRAQQAMANQAFQEGTSVTKEFDVQNNTVQAGLEKAKKRFNEMAVELGEKLAPAMKYAITSSAAMMKALSTAVTFISQHTQALVNLSIVLAGYTIAVKASAIATAAHSAATKAAAVVTAGWNAIVSLGTSIQKGYTYVLGLARVAQIAFTSGTTAARIAFAALNATIKTNPFGLLITAVTAAALAIYNLRKKTEDARAEQERLRKASLQSAEAIRQAEARIGEETSAVKRLTDAINAENVGSSKRNALIKQFNDKFGGYLSNLLSEKSTAQQVAAAYKEVVKHLRAKLLLEAKENDFKQTVGVRYGWEAQRLADFDKVAGDHGFAGGGAWLKAAADEAWASGARSWDKVQSYVFRAYAKQTQKQFGKIPGEQGFDDADLQEAMTAYTRQYVSTRVYQQQVERKWQPYEDEIDAAIEDAYSYDGGSGDRGSVTTTGSETTTGSGGGHTTEVDKFKAEKDWREQQIALAKIANFKGETDYEQHQQRLEQIDMEYANKLLERTDLTENERLDAQAKYWEAKQKLDKRAQAHTIAEENAAYEDLRRQVQEDYLQNRISKETFDMQMENIEFAHLRALTQLTKEGTEERRRAEETYRQRLVADQQKRHAEYIANEKAQREKLDAVWEKYAEDEESKREKMVEETKKTLTLAYEMRKALIMNDDSLSPDEKAKQLSELENKYKKAIKSIDDAAKATGKSWEDWIGKALDKIFGQGTWDQYGETIKNAFASMTSMMQSFNQLAQAEAEIKVARLERQYDREISMAEGNNRKVKALERKKEKETARIKAEAQRKEFAQQVMNAISSTALAAINAYASASKIAWWLGPVAAGMALAAGAVQVAAIKKQQEASEAKGFAEGGFTPKGPKDKAVGVVHAGEWVASQRLLANPVARPMIDALDYAQRNNTLGSLRPADVSRSVTAPAVIAGAASDGQTEQLMVAVAAALGNYDGTMARLTDRLNEPFVTVNTVTGDMGIKEAQDEYQRLMNNTLPKSKRK